MSISVHSRPIAANILSARECEVLRLIAKGKSSKEVAKELYCSKRTVDFHLGRIYTKLDVSNRVQALTRAQLPA